MQHGCVYTPDPCRLVCVSLTFVVLCCHATISIVQTVRYADIGAGICLLYSFAVCLLCNMLVMSLAYTIL